MSWTDGLADRPGPRGAAAVEVAVPLHRPDPCVDPQLGACRAGRSPAPPLLPRTGSASRPTGRPSGRRPGPPARDAVRPRPSRRSGARRGRRPPTRTHRSTTRPSAPRPTRTTRARSRVSTAAQPPRLGGEVDRAPPRHRSGRPVSSVGMSSPRRLELGGERLDVVTPPVRAASASSAARGGPQLERRAAVRQVDQPQPGRLVRALGVATKRGRSTSYQCRSQPSAEAASRPRRPRPGRVQVASVLELGQRAGPRAVGAVPAAAGAPGDRTVQDVDGGRRQQIGQRRGAQPVVGLGTSRSRRARSRVNALLASVRSPASSGGAGCAPSRARRGVGLGARQPGSGSPVCSSTPVARSEPLAASDPARSVTACGSSRSQPRTRTTYRPEAAAIPRVHRVVRRCRRADGPEPGVVGQLGSGRLRPG